MSSLALISAMRGYTVSGSDVCAKKRCAELLARNGIKMTHYHDIWNTVGYDVLVRTGAVSKDNPDVVTAHRAGIPVYTRSEFMGGMLSEYEKRTGVAGTHGKSTVSGMLASIFDTSTVLIGAEALALGSSFRIGDNGHVIYEACEYKKAFLDMKPTEALILNIEREHTDCYKTVSDAVNAYKGFISEAKSCILFADDKNVMKLAPYAEGVVLFSLCDPKADLYAENICENKGFYSFDAVWKGKTVFTATLRVSGIHNLKNALAASAVALSNGIAPNKIKSGVEAFTGMKRRLEKLGVLNGADVYDDYAHHPTEIKSTLSALRKTGYAKIFCAFQPHTFSRTASLFDEFTTAFGDTDEVAFADIFAARERNLYGVNSRELANATPNGVYIPSYDGIFSYLASRAGEGTALVTLGAGELDAVGERLASLGKNS